MDMVSYVLGQYPALMDAGLSGYTYYAADFHVSPNASIGGITGSVALFDTQDPQDLLGLLAPALDHINATWPGEFNSTLVPTVYGSFWEYFAVRYDQSPAGADQLTGSRLFDREALEQRATGEALGRLVKEAFVMPVFLVGGKGVAEVVPRGGSNAVLPAWRKAYIHTRKLGFFSLLHAVVLLS